MYWTLIKTGLIRKRTRTFLTIMSLFVAFLLFGSLQTFTSIFTGSVKGLSAKNIIVMPRYDLFGKQPLSVAQYIETLDGVEKVMYFDILMADSIESMMDGVVFAASPNFFDVYTRFATTDEAEEALKSTQSAAIVGKLMAKEKGIKIGDKLSLKASSMNSDGTYNWSFDVVGFYTVDKLTGDEMGAIVNWGAFDEARLTEKGTVSMIMAQISDSTLADSISNQIDERFMNSSYATRSGPESMLAVEMAGEIADIKLIMNAILLSVFFTILLVSANTMAQSIRERTIDIGVLKCLGYKDRQLFTSVILEAIFLTFVATAMGLLATLLLIPVVVELSDGMLANTFNLDLKIIFNGFLLGLLVAFLAAAIPSYQALTLKVVDALRKD